MILAFMLLADYANFEREGKLNVMGIFNNIYAKSYPATHPQMFLVFRLFPDFGEVGDKEISIQLRSEKNTEIFRMTAQMQLPTEPRLPKPFDTIMDLKNIAFPEAGRYHFTLRVGGVKQGDLYVNLTLVSE